MVVTIYTLGDVATFRGILNAVASVFNSGLLTSGSGLGVGSAILMGSLLSLFILIGKAAFDTGGKTDASTFKGVIVMVLVFYVMAVPRSTVQIEDVYAGTTTAVDNVPIGLALPGAIISTITYGIADKIETAFSTVSGNYIALSASGFANPLSLLMSLRDGVSAMPLLSASVSAIIQDCAVGNTTFNAEDFSKAADLVAYIEAHYDPGMTLYYNAANPQGVTETCGNAIAFLKTDLSDAISGTNDRLKQVINKKMSTRQVASAATSGVYTVDDLRQAHTNIISGVVGATQTADAFMANSLLASAAADSYNCQASATSPADMQTCTLLQQQVAEKYKIETAVAAGFFQKTMIPAMNLMLALFYAFSPLIFIFAVVAGLPYGLEILKKFMLFGVWTQTWIPFAAVINYIVQVQVVDEMNRFAIASPNGLTINSQYALYDLLSVKLALASDMLAMTPMISLALLTGSVYSLSQVAGRLSRGQSKDADAIMARDYASSGSLVQMRGMAETSLGVAGKGGVSQSFSGVSQPKWSGGTAKSLAMSVAASDVKEASRSLEAAMSKGFGDQAERGRQWLKEHGSGGFFSKTTSALDSHVQQVAEALEKGGAINKSQMSEFSAAYKEGFAGSLGAGVPGFFSAKASLDGALQRIGKLNGTTTSSDGYKNVTNTTNGLTSSTQLQSQFQESASERKNMGASDKKVYTNNSAYTEALAARDSAAVREQAATDLKEDDSVMYSMDLNQLSAAMDNRNIDEAKALAGLGGSERTQAVKRIDELSSVYKKNFGLKDRDARQAATAMTMNELSGQTWIGKNLTDINRSLDGRVKEKQEAVRTKVGNLEGAAAAIGSNTDRQVNAGQMEANKQTGGPIRSIDDLMAKGMAAVDGFAKTTGKKIEGKANAAGLGAGMQKRMQGALNGLLGQFDADGQPTRYAQDEMIRKVVAMAGETGRDFGVAWEAIKKESGYTKWAQENPKLAAALNVAGDVAAEAALLYSPGRWAKGAVDVAKATKDAVAAGEKFIAGKVGGAKNVMAAEREYAEAAKIGPLPGNAAQRLDKGIVDAQKAAEATDAANRAAYEAAKAAKEAAEKAAAGGGKSMAHRAASGAENAARSVTAGGVALNTQLLNGQEEQRTGSLSPATPLPLQGGGGFAVRPREW